MAEQEPTDGGYRLSDNALRAVVYVALAIGGGGGLYTIQSSQGGYDAEDAVRELALRDERIARLQRDVERLEATVRGIDDTHPPPDLIRDLDDHEARLRDLERK